ncbi:MAG TPA: phosphate ABC transporter substrate-binding protein [Kiritimatiellia bacterium]|nr:phosphate ABC transporter substrate-binding protein [Kiritimatiellia bacterium]
MPLKRCHLAVVLIALLPLCAMAETIRVKGSNTFGEELGPRLINAYRVVNTALTIELEHEGSQSGIAALLDRATDIATSTRPLSEDEVRLAASRNIDIESHVIGYYGISVILHAGNPVRNLTDRHVHDLFSGGITNWKNVGGPDLPVVVMIRDPSSGTYLGFQELALKGSSYREDALTFLSYFDIAEAVAAEPGAIGFIGMSFEAEGILPVSINGIPGNFISVIEGLYPYARQIRFMTLRRDTPRSAMRFISYVQSRRGQAILEDMGYVPRHVTRTQSPEF